MAETDWGARDSRGEWRPAELPRPSPLFQLPWRPKAVARYLFAPESFLWPYNSLYALLAVVSWLLFTPGLERTATFRLGWVAEIYLRNAAILLLIEGGAAPRAAQPRRERSRKPAPAVTPERAVETAVFPPPPPTGAQP